MSLRTVVRSRIGRVYHRLRPYKHIENSTRGVRLAQHGGFKSIDLDLQITRDGVIVACHDGQPLRHGFFDPFGQIHKDAKIHDLTWAQVSRLRARTGSRLYRIQRIEHLLHVCKRLNRVALLEPKADDRFALEWPWQYIAETAEEYGTRIAVRALVELDGRRHVAAADRAGIEAWTIKEN